ncbi:hypothetical protein, partial [Reyranella soli]|uniref:hypothetical protein n=1 Tax=Reyranella soli TaxID=1230389 RepID=UPI001C3F83E8
VSSLDPVWANATVAITAQETAPTISGVIRILFSTTLSDPVVTLEALCDLWFLKTCPIIRLAAHLPAEGDCCSGVRT